ncbi:MAG: NYN domain-containing protein [bacterium]
MPLIIDTYNVLHVTGVLPPELAVGEPEALARLVSASRYAADAVWLVCDGVPRGASHVGRILIEGAGPGRSADDHIMRFLDRSSAPRRVTVVTSDRAIARHARARGAEAIRSENFLAHLAEDVRRARPRKPTSPDPRRSVPLGEREVAGWMRLFGITAEHAAIAGSAPLPRRETRPTTSRDTVAERGRNKTGPDARARSDDAALERYLEATKDLADPLAILDGAHGTQLLSTLGAIDDAMLEALMKEHEPPILKDGARIGGRKRVNRAQRDQKRDTP